MIYFYEKYAFKTHRIISIINEWIIAKRGRIFVQHPVRNVFAKFKVDCFNRFCIGARQVFNTRKALPCEISLTMKTATSDSQSKSTNWFQYYNGLRDERVKHIFLIKLPSVNQKVINLRALGISLYYFLFSVEMK